MKLIDCLVFTLIGLVLGFALAMAYNDHKPAQSGKACLMKAHNYCNQEVNKPYQFKPKHQIVIET